MVSRRDVFKFAGAGGVGVGAGLLLGEVNQRPLETLLSTHIPPEDFSPGLDTWYNTLCRMCPAGCGISVKVREGRARKIEGNAAHPVNRGGTCALGQASLNALYNPDRLRSPMRADGEGVHDMQRRALRRALERPPRRLPVDQGYVGPEPSGPVRREGGERLPLAFGIEGPGQARKGVTARNPMPRAS